MSNQTKETVAALRGRIADLAADDATLDALHAIVKAQLALLDAVTNSIIAATSTIAVEPGNRYVVGFAGDIIENGHNALSAIEATDKALDVLLAEYSAKYENAAHSLKAPA